MIRKKVVLAAVGLIGLGVIASDAWTQQETKTQSVTITSGDDQTSRPTVTAFDVVIPARIDPLVNNPGEANGASDIVFSSGYVGGPAPVSGPMRQKLVNFTVSRVVREPIPAEELEEQQKIQKAIKSLNADNETEKKVAAETLQSLLVKQFDRDLTVREKELVAVEQRLNTLRQQLQKRKASRDEIVGLRFKTLINSAEGLGFPGEDPALNPAAPIPIGIPTFEPDKLPATQPGRGIPTRAPF